MLDWTSMFAIAVILAAPIIGWWRGWSMLHALVAAMTGVFIVGVVGLPRVDVSIVASPALQELAWRPEYLTLDAWMHWPTILTNLFLHADVLHLLVNTVVFVFMGLGLEEHIGRPRFFMLFLVAGVFGTLLHSAATLGSSVPLVGASGSVFGVIGAYAYLYPRDRVVLFMFLILPNVPVYIAALVYVAVEVVALEAVGAASQVAHHAHIGGLVGGVLVALVLVRRGPVATKGPARVVTETTRLRDLVETDEQKRLYESLVANQDEPDVARAWLEKLARALPCPECGEPLEAVGGSLRSPCGYVVRLDRPRA